jgi:dTDP-4-dehydrorhamnose reductase
MTSEPFKYLGSHPEAIDDENSLEELMSRPTKQSIEMIGKIVGDIIILGAGGKIGPSLAKFVKRVVTEAGIQKKVWAASRFSDFTTRKILEDSGVETISCDLLKPVDVESLPDATNIIYLAGMKFGASGNQPLTWATNVYTSALVAERYRDSRIVVFSTGNVYPLVPVESGGAKESTEPNPVGEYAQSCLGRERIYQYFSSKNGTKILILRLNYAAELRYGVLLDIAEKVSKGKPIDLGTGYVNVIWQGDVNDAALRCLELYESPPKILNVTGSDAVSVRWLAERFGEILHRKPKFTNVESDLALLSDSSEYHLVLGHQSVDVETMIQWVAHWVSIGGPTLNKPTKFEVRDGRF